MTTVKFRFDIMKYTKIEKYSFKCIITYPQLIQRLESLLGLERLGALANRVDQRVRCSEPVQSFALRPLSFAALALGSNEEEESKVVSNPAPFHP